MTTRRHRAYQRRMQKLIDKVDKLEERELKRVADILEQARAEVAARVAQTPWEAHHIAQLKEAIANAIRGFERQYGAAASGHFSNMWNAGIDMVDAPLASAGVRTAAPEISRTVLEILQGYSADFIEGLAADALKKVNNAVTMSILGQQTPYEAMKMIGVSLDEKGIFPAIMRRAETIMRTEGGRINSAARHARQQAVVDAGTDPPMTWQKRWHSSGKAHPREEHAALDGVTVDFNEDFPGGRPYPHAPGLSADETINCGCTHSLESPDWDKLPKQFTPVAYVERADYGRAA